MSVPPEAPSRVATDGRLRTDSFGEAICEERPSPFRGVRASTWSNAVAVNISSSVAPLGKRALTLDEAARLIHILG